jgi:hypothetical protein
MSVAADGLTEANLNFVPFWDKMQTNPDTPTIENSLICSVKVANKAVSLHNVVK